MKLKTEMIQKINTVEHVKIFFTQLLDESLNFHPDTPFEDYINGETRLDTYTIEEAAIRNKLLEQSFYVCEAFNIDIYELCMEIFQ